MRQRQSVLGRLRERRPRMQRRMQEAGAASGYRVLAVTACPTGIAHTYMAAEGIEKAAKARNCFIKVETRGSGGAKNVLTDQEIQEADCIIVAADAQVPMERFDGKKLIECQVSDGISKADAWWKEPLQGMLLYITQQREHRILRRQQRQAEAPATKYIRSS